MKTAIFFVPSMINNLFVPFKTETTAAAVYRARDHDRAVKTEQQLVKVDFAKNNSFSTGL